MKKTDVDNFLNFEDDIFEELRLDEADIALLEKIDHEIESTLKNIKIYDLQTNKKMADFLSEEINNQGERINKLVDDASPQLKKFLVGRIEKIKGTYLN
ncbi:MAG: hypothetical protein PHY13_00645 [Clostridia bacterium]|nr:hypothetical protein [Clostridia bacterium]MDD3970701.1 hypothetical protein [Clostridia bacterium]MDD4542265.1 hypothetical protein [Clostridia bacterium]